MAISSSCALREASWHQRCVAGTPPKFSRSYSFWPSRGSYIETWSRIIWCSIVNGIASWSTWATLNFQMKKKKYKKKTIWVRSRKCKLILRRWAVDVEEPWLARLITSRPKWSKTRLPFQRQTCGPSVASSSKCTQEKCRFQARSHKLYTRKSLTERSTGRWIWTRMLATLLKKSCTWTRRSAWDQRGRHTT